jgi:recombination associated protein RdgC
MWFKQVRLFQLTDAFCDAPTILIEKLEALLFRECLPSMPYSAGWIPSIDHDDVPLIQTINGYTMICLQIEEKILPPMVIRQELAKKIKRIEESENRKVDQKEKYALKDEITATLLPRAFSKLTRVYAYIDTKNHWLILGTANTKKAEQFLSTFKKTFDDKVDAFQIKKLSAMMTSWLKNQNYSSSFSIEKSCVLQDTNHESRVIRCKEQDLFANSIQSLIKDGCEVRQLALNWQDRIHFVLLDDLSLQGIQFKDEIKEQVKEREADTQQQQFHADFLMMTETLNGLFKDLLNAVAKKSTNIDKMDASNVVSMVKRVGS